MAELSKSTDFEDHYKSSEYVLSYLKKAESIERNVNIQEATMWLFSSSNQPHTCVMYHHPIHNGNITIVDERYIIGLSTLNNISEVNIKLPNYVYKNI